MRNIIGLLLCLLCLSGCDNEESVNMVEVGGSVSFYTGKDLSDIKINVTNNKSGASFSVYTDSKGDYSFNKKSSDSYTICAEKAGFSFTPEKIIVDNSKSLVGEFTGVLTWELGTTGDSEDRLVRVFHQYNDDGTVAGYFLAGTSYDGLTDHTCLFIKNIDIFGTLLDSRVYRLNHDFVLEDGVKLSEGGIVLCATGFYDELLKEQTFILKVDEELNIVDDWSFFVCDLMGADCGISAKGLSIKESAHGDLVISGSKESESDDLADCFLWKISSDKSFTNLMIAGQNYEDCFKSVDVYNGVTVAGGFRTRGGSDFNLSDKQFWIVGSDAAGVVFERSGFDSEFDLVENEFYSGCAEVIFTDSGDIVGLINPVSAQGDNSSMVICFEMDGTVKWLTNLTNRDGLVLKDIINSSDGGFALCGEYKRWDSTLTGGVVYKLNGNGAVQWQKSYDRDSNSTLDYIVETYDSGYIICGREENVQLSDDTFVLKTNSLGEIPVDYREVFSEDK